MRRRYLSPASFKFVVILLAGMFLLGAGLMAVKYESSLPKPGDRLVEGRIIKMEVQKTTSNAFRSSRRIVSYDTFLTIKIVNTNTVVTTILDGDWTGRLPDVVTFYYSGDPTRRVFLQQDNSPLMGVVLFSIIGLTVLLGLIVVLMLYKRAERYRHEQHKALLEKIDRF